ncbi:MAG: hypothetical protein HY791_01250 [Deltaproteobacteria bacterium]|nr:hypothetical protein [Deltaproteobacteria bacterium]
MSTLRLPIPANGPSRPGFVTSAGVGYNFSCALLESKALRCVGSNIETDLGLADSGVEDIELVHDALQIATGLFFICARLADGRVECWGSDSRQLGRGDRMPAGTQVAPVLGIADAVSVAAGIGHACAILASGRVVCWGSNHFEQLGDREHRDFLEPIEAPFPEPAKQLALGSDHTCALLANRGIWCMGSNAVGQRGVAGAVPSIINAVPDIVDAAEIVSGVDQICVRTQGGEVWCWGSLTLGDRPTRLAVGASAIFGREGAMCVISDASQPIFCFGRTYAEAPSPDPLTRFSSDSVAQLSPGRTHACLVTKDGKMECAGSNAGGQLGVPFDSTRKDPTPVPGISATAIFVGGSTSCVKDTLENVSCFGANEGGIFGSSSTFETSPFHVESLTAASQIEFGGDGVSCATSTASERPRCWKQGQTTPLALSGVTDLSLGVQYGCGVTQTGEVYCWGDNRQGQLGDGSQVSRTAPELVLRLPPATRVAACPSALGHTCALTESQEVFCWGANSKGQLGGGPAGGTVVPNRVSGLHSVTDIGVGSTHSCALREGSVWCWGENERGQLGDGTRTRRQQPRALGRVHDVAGMAVSGDHTCLWTIQGEVWCTGSSFDPTDLADDDLVLRRMPGLANIIAVGAAPTHLCALTRGGEVSCWGSDLRGQLGLSSALRIDELRELDISE